MFRTASTRRLFFHPPLRRTYATYKRFDNASPSHFSTSYFNFLKNRKTLYVGAGFLAFYLYNQNEAPFTHRRRFIWIPYSLERKIGDYSYQQIHYQYQSKIIPHNHPLYAKVSNVMNRLLSVAFATAVQDPDHKQHLQNLDWEINIIAADSSMPPNAFILPNGKIFVFSSIIPICEDDQGLATVLAHELSHQLAQHSLEQLSAQPFYILISTLLYSVTGISWFNDLLINGLLTMPASREMESEADRIGCELMARACFQPESAIGFWNRMKSAEKSFGGMAMRGPVSDIFSTHPNTTKRIDDIKKWMPELRSIRENSGCYDYGRFENFSRNFFGRGKL